MRLSTVCAAIAALYTPVMVFALGLGDMTIQSSLNQPFMAEIALLDVDNLPLSAIKVKLASYDDFERAGLARSESLDTLDFTVTKNTSGKPIIRIQSTDRMEDPYLELLIDMAWATGQFYREYTVLLDPPGYSMVNTYSAPKTISMPSIKQPGVVYKPTVSEVNHHLGDNVAATESSKAYNVTVANQTTFVETPTPLHSELPAVPELKKPAPSNTLLTNLLQAVPGAELLSDGNKANGQQANMAIKAEVDMAASALETMRESNALLKEELSTLQKNNQQLQIALSDKNKAFEKLQLQVTQLMSERKAVAGQTTQPTESNGSLLNMLLLMLLSLGAGVAGAYGWRRYQLQTSDDVMTGGFPAWSSMFTKSKDPVDNPEELDADHAVTIDEPVARASLFDEAPVLDDINLEDLKLEEMPIESLAIEPEESEDIETVAPGAVIEELEAPLNDEESAFLSSFDVDIKPTKPKKSAKASKSKLDPADKPLDVDVGEQLLKEEDDFSIDFDLTPTPKSDTKLTKSTSALKTQIELAKTYIAMGDVTTARQSLKEVIAHGDDALKEEAQKMLDEL